MKHNFAENNTFLSGIVINFTVILTLNTFSRTVSGFGNSRMTFASAENLD
jgi:hypothetical protein